MGFPDQQEQDDIFKSEKIIINELCKNANIHIIKYSEGVAVINVKLTDEHNQLCFLEVRKIQGLKTIYIFSPSVKLAQQETLSSETLIEALYDIENYLFVRWSAYKTNAGSRTITCSCCQSVDYFFKEPEMLASYTQAISSFAKNLQIKTGLSLT